MSHARPLLITLPFKVQTYDIDVARHVNNQVYIRWLEDLRTAFLEAHCPLDGLLAAGHMPVLYSTHIEYRRPITLFQPVEGRMWLSALGRTSFTVGAEFLVAHKLHANASQRGMLIDMETNRPARWPRQLVEDYAREHGKGASA